MTVTTIKVSSDLRDRLKAQAGSAGLTLGDHLARLADLADREQRFVRLKQAIDGSTVEDLDSWSAETEEWETAELTDGR